MTRAPELSIVAPAYEEQDNLRPLHARVVEALPRELDWELLIVDDGSRDQSARVLRELCAEDARVRALLLERNLGQSGATLLGLRAARAPLLATMDADLQNDPADLPLLLEALGEHDAAVGYRRVRKDSWTRRASSRVANAVRNWLSGDRVRDTGCALKLFRAEAVRALPWFDGAHRFLPTLLRYHGFAVVEVGVGHHPRRAGRSKYGIWNRAWRTARDLLAVRWLRTRALRFPAVEEISRGEGW